jgi:hypothetical protein
LIGSEPTSGTMGTVNAPLDGGTHHLFPSVPVLQSRDSQKRWLVPDGCLLQMHVVPSPCSARLFRQGPAARIPQRCKRKSRCRVGAPRSSRSPRDRLPSSMGTYSCLSFCRARTHVAPKLWCPPSDRAAARPHSTAEVNALVMAVARRLEGAQTNS